MKKTFSVFFCLALAACSNDDKAITPKDALAETKTCCAGAPGALTCKLTTAELRQRKATVIASLKNLVIEKRELPNGFAFKFHGSDDTVDALTEFIKTERRCCDFFSFDLSVSGDESEAWLRLTGPDGAKAFITDELGL